MGGATSRRRAGFSLIEAVVAITISTAVVFMAASVFLVQNDFYGFLLDRSRTQENARGFLEVVERDVGSLVGAALVAADSTRIALRTPQTLGAVCRIVGSDHYVHLASVDALVPATAMGFGARSAAGTWSFGTGSVAGALQGQGPTSAAMCAAAGADTVGASQEFFRVPSLSGLTGVAHTEGDVIMVYDLVELWIDASTLDPALLALYRGVAGEASTEYTTGVAAGGVFEYQVGGTWRGRVTGTDLDLVDAIRIRAGTFQPGESGIGSDADFTLQLDLPLRNR